MRRFPDDFPAELLEKIMNCFDSEIGERTFYSDSELDSNIKTIQDLRLTCRRLCEISSPLLVPYIIVSPSLSSLDRVDQIMSHTTIYRGLRRIFVDMSLLKRSLAANFDAFAYAVYLRLEGIAEEYRRKSAGSREKDFLEKAYCAYDIVKSLLEPSDPTQARDPLPYNLNKSQPSVRRALQQEHARYQRLHREQEDILRSGRLTHTVAAVAARSQSNVFLYISDEGRHQSLTQALHKHGKRDVDFDFVLRFTANRRGRWSGEQNDQDVKSPQSTLYELPLAIAEARADLTEFIVELSDLEHPSDRKLDITQEQISALFQVSTGLKTFKFEARVSEHGDESLPGYLSAVISSQKLRKLSLNLSFMDHSYRDRPSDPHTIGPLRLSGTWDRLETLSLKKYSIHLNELNKLLDALKSGTDIILDDITLLSGSWAEALDCIRSKAGVGSTLIDCGGSEVKLMSNNQRWPLFNWPVPNPRDGKATQYIRSLDGVNNPIREFMEAREATAGPGGI